MSALRDAAQQALEAMEYNTLDISKFNRINAACQALRAALAEQPAEQEPYCYTYTENGEEYFAPPTGHRSDHAKPLYTAPQPAIPPGWATAYAAFKGAFDTPLARRRDSGEYAQDARRLLREFNDAMLAAPEAPQPRKRLTDEEIAAALRPCFEWEGQVDEAMLMHIDEYRAIEDAIWSKT